MKLILDKNATSRFLKVLASEDRPRITEMLHLLELRKCIIGVPHFPLLGWQTTFANQRNPDECIDEPYVEVFGGVLTNWIQSDSPLFQNWYRLWVWHKEEIYPEVMEMLPSITA